MKLCVHAETSIASRLQNSAFAIAYEENRHIQSLIFNFSNEF
jgi:hypothetical protein